MVTANIPIADPEISKLKYPVTAIVQHPDRPNFRSALPVELQAEVPVTLDDANLDLPLYATEFSAGMDIKAYIPGDDQTYARIELLPGACQLIGTGLHFAIPSGYFGALFARSGRASREGLRLANGVGVLDSDYRGELKVPLYNDSSRPITIYSGERIAQLVIIPYVRADLFVVDKLEDSDRGSGGFGSTGI